MMTKPVKNFPKKDWDGKKILSIDCKLRLKNKLEYSQKSQYNASTLTQIQNDQLPSLCKN